VAVFISSFYIESVLVVFLLLNVIKGMMLVFIQIIALSKINHIG